MSEAPYEPDDLDRRIIAATQDGFALVRDPFEAVAAQVGISAGEVRQRMRAMLDTGVIRRIGAVPNHYALGMRANGMSVWDVRDDAVEELGRLVGRLDFVSHCYRRPRHLPVWPYNLFAMVHGRERREVEAKVETNAELIGINAAGHDVLYSTRILKKTGLRIAA